MSKLAGAVEHGARGQGGGDGFGIATGLPGGMPASSLSARDWVDAVVGDNVEVVIAMHDVGHRPMLTEPWQVTRSEPTRRSARSTLCIVRARRSFHGSSAGLIGHRRGVGSTSTSRCPSVVVSGPPLPTGTPVLLRCGEDQIGMVMSARLIVPLEIERLAIGDGGRAGSGAHLTQASQNRALGDGLGAWWPWLARTLGRRAWAELMVVPHPRSITPWTSGSSAHRFDRVWIASSKLIDSPSASASL